MVMEAEGYEVEEVAAIAKLPSGTVRSRTTRMRQMLLVAVAALVVALVSWAVVRHNHKEDIVRTAGDCAFGDRASQADPERGEASLRAIALENSACRVSTRRSRWTRSGTKPRRFRGCAPKRRTP